MIIQACHQIVSIGISSIGLSNNNGITLTKPFRLLPVFLSNYIFVIVVHVLAIQKFTIIFGGKGEPKITILL